MEERREQIIKRVKKEMIGPDPIEGFGMIQDDGEEILIGVSPSEKYTAGVLYSNNVPVDSDSSTDESGVNVNNADDSDEPEIQKGAQISNFDDLESYAEELIDRSNAFKPSAMSMTVCISSDDSVKVHVEAAQYKAKKFKPEGYEKEIDGYFRKPLCFDQNDKVIDLPHKRSMVQIDFGYGLKLDITYRFKTNEGAVYTITLENSNTKASDEFYFFQVGFSLLSSNGFKPLPTKMIKDTNDDDYLSNQLLYRNVRNYAAGHGCATEWNENEELVKTISSAVFPVHEVKPIVPMEMKDTVLSMKDMSSEATFENAIGNLEKLCRGYDKWIEASKARIADLDEGLQSTAKRHISKCCECLSRMKDGLSLLKNNQNAKICFQYMNLAMLMQQLHSKLPTQKWIIEDNIGHMHLKKEFDKLPDVENPDTWYGNSSAYGKWRPFQIAFIIMNLRAMIDNESEDRKKIDLIWFPTGGGKTEAYLGLSAFTIFYGRLVHKKTGTSVLMRYTLRLLTSQQYQRASSLICACEIIRRGHEKEFGKEAISIGLWVGGETTPNTQKIARERLQELESGYTDENPFSVLKCPWCGAQMGIVKSNDFKNRIVGYTIKKERGGSSRFIFRCSNKAQGCSFASENDEMPLYVVDEDIYNKKPTLLLGTVDKFATIPFRHEARGIFGLGDDGKHFTSPDLIIQDELHLISGPLGSMVGHYETMIHALSTRIDGKHVIEPKTIASTATISHAKEQCKALYDCNENNVVQFPPPGIDAGDSFFAHEDKNSNGRKYVGILTPGTDDSSATIRLYASLLVAGKELEVSDEKEKDPYWTIIGYFNSIRELGHASQWVDEDIKEYLNTMYVRRFNLKRFTQEENKENRRYIYRETELTSRITGERLTENLQDLETPYPPSNNSETGTLVHPLDICLATNMISVGLDIQRLGLMVVQGQPKTTSEYIQATSRVGRNVMDGPGLVFVFYRPGKPRDKSHYENFKYYHSSLYKHVEPTSVTPFSSPVRNRALNAVLFSLVRTLSDSEYNNSKGPKELPDQQILDQVKEIIRKRVHDVDPAEEADTIAEINKTIRKWNDQRPSIWTPKKIYPYTGFTDEVPLMIQSGVIPNPDWGDKGFPVPTSMRSVDRECRIKVLSDSYSE